MTDLDLLDGIEIFSEAEIDAMQTAVTAETPIYLEEGEIDPRLKLLSHSSRTTLHSCPRKYQLYRKSSKQIALNEEKETEQGVSFAYGTVVGIGIQSVFEGKPETQAILDMFLAWDVDLLDSNQRQKKSFWEAVFAVQQFVDLVAAGNLDDYELVYYKGKPAVELSFQILLPDGFRYRGFVDAVLKNKVTGEIIVLEVKTTSMVPNSAIYKNSGQALGYSIVLDILFPKLSSYEVLYLVYATKSRSFVPFTFSKSHLQRALWLQELLIDKQKIELFEEFVHYPTHGENCFSFYRECEYLSLCNLDTALLTKPLTQNILDKIKKDEKEYMFTVDFKDLVQSQLDKGEI